MRVLAVLLAGLAAVPPPAAADPALARQILDQGAVVHHYDALLTDFLALAVERGDVARNPAVGRADPDATLHVIVVAAPQDAQADALLARLPVTRAEASRNMLAVAPSLVIVGEELFATLLLTMFNDLGMVLQALESRDPAIQADPMAYAAAMTGTLRMGNLRNAATRASPDELPTSLGPAIAQSLAEIWSDGNAAAPFYAGLLFLFGHEIAHLDQDRDGGFLDVRQWLRDWRAARVRAEERRADAVARALMRRAIERDDHLYDLITLSAVMNHLRDEMLLRFFDDLRPISAEELFFTFLHRSCEDRDQLDPYGVRTDNIEMVRGGYWNVPPVLDAGELAAVRARIDADRRYASHEHNFLRADDVARDLIDMGRSLGPMNTIAPFVRFYEAVARGEPYLQADQITGATSLPADRLMNGLGAGSLPRSPACAPGLDCYAGAGDGDAWVEVIAEDGVVKHAVLYHPLIWENIDALDPADPAQAARAEAYVRNMAGMVARMMVFRSLGHELAGQDAEPDGMASIEEAALMRQRLIQCGFYTSVSVLGDAVFEITTLRAGSDGWVRMKVFPATHDILSLR